MLLQAVTLLHQLGAIDPAGYVTLVGKQMGAFPMLHASTARMLVEAARRYVS